MQFIYLLLTAAAASAVALRYPYSDDQAIMSNPTLSTDSDTGREEVESQQRHLERDFPGLELVGLRDHQEGSRGGQFFMGPVPDENVETIEH